MRLKLFTREDLDTLYRVNRAAIENAPSKAKKVRYLRLRCVFRLLEHAFTLENVLSLRREDLHFEAAKLYIKTPEKFTELSDETRVCIRAYMAFTGGWDVKYVFPSYAET